MERIIQRLKAFRLLNKMSQKDLAIKAGISPVTLSRIEKGEDCKISVILKLEDALGVKLF